ncbi:MAG TPA: hypothetical protein VGK33_08385 [Chloroflexota bacterium]
MIPSEMAALPGGDAAPDRALCTQVESGGNVYLILYAGHGGQGAKRWCDSLVAGEATAPVNPGLDLPHAGPDAVVSTCALFMADPGDPSMYSWGTVWSSPQGMDDAVDQCSLISAELLVTWRAGLQPTASGVVPVSCADGWTTSRETNPTRARGTAEWSPTEGRHLGRSCRSVREPAVHLKQLPGGAVGGTLVGALAVAIRFALTTA